MFHGTNRIVIDKSESQADHFLMALENLAVRRAAAPDPELKCPNCRQIVQQRPIPSIGINNVCQSILGDSEASEEEMVEEGWAKFFQSSLDVQLVLGAFVLEPRFVLL